MEDSSHELIEQLISKEKYCFDNTNPTEDGINSVREPVSPHPTLYHTGKQNVDQSLGITSAIDKVDSLTRVSEIEGTHICTIFSMLKKVLV